MGLNEIIKDRIANGEKIYHMAFGQSPFPIYEKAVERLKEHAGENEYLPVAGKIVLIQFLTLLVHSLFLLLSMCTPFRRFSTLVWHASLDVRIFSVDLFASTSLKICYFSDYV